MTLKQEFLAALRSGEGHEALLKLVGSHQARGLAPEDTYKVLEGIWLEFGFDNSAEDSPLRNNLEFVMERNWFQGSDILGGVTAPQRERID